MDNKIYYINNQETNINEPYYSDFSDNKLNSLILSNTFIEGGLDYVVGSINRVPLHPQKLL